MEKYKEIAASLAEKIQTGELSAGMKLPSENELCQQYDVSRITIKKATDLLLHQGLINKRRGSGTFVKDVVGASENGTITEVDFSGFSKQFEGRSTTSEIVLFEVIPAKDDVAEALRLSNEQFVYHIIRRRSLDNDPYVVEYTYMPIDLIPGITRQILQSSIYGYIQDTLGLRLRSAHRTIRALLPTKEEKDFFATKKPIAILEIAQIAYLDDGRIFEDSRSHLRGDRYSFQSVSVR